MISEYYLEVGKCCFCEKEAKIFYFKNNLIKTTIRFLCRECALKQKQILK